MTIGITGSTGQLGRLVIKELLNVPDAGNIVALARSLEKAADLGTKARLFDYSKPEGLANALHGIEALLLISGSEVGKRASQHASVIEAAKKAHIKYIVYTSLLRADTSTLTLAAEHFETENTIKNSGIPFTILRNGWYTENYTASLAGVIASGILFGASGDGKISSATRADYALAAARVLTSEGHKNKMYELAGDESFTMSDFAAAITRQTGKSITYKNLPADEYVKVLVAAGLPQGAAQFYAGTHRATEKGDLFDNHHVLSKLIGRPTTSLAQAVADAVAQLK